MPYMWHERFRFHFHFLFFSLDRCSKGYIWRFVDVESFPKGRGGIAWQREDWLCVVVYGFGRDVEEKTRNPGFWREVNIRKLLRRIQAVLCTVLLEIDDHSGYIRIEFLKFKCMSITQLPRVMYRQAKRNNKYKEIQVF